MSARLRLLPRTLAPPARKPGVWGPLAAPVNPGETHARMCAQSALTGLPLRDGSTVAPFLPLDHALDVLAWLQTTVKT